jgi:nucleotide-binding universal stress UspA family protein
MSTDTRTITVGIDGSRSSLDAADWAAREAQRRRLPLRLLHAGTEPASLDRAAIELSYAHPALDIIARRTATPAVPALLAAAVEAETLVLGSRGRTGSAGFPVGSVALGVAARADRPVVLVRAGELPEDERVPVVDGSPPSTAPYLPVVLGLDPDASADDLIGYAFDTAAVRSAPLHVVHPWTLPTSTLRPWRHRFPATTVREHRVDGDPGPRLLEASARAGLLVVGRRTGRGPGRDARSLIRHADCPVAVVPHD